MRELGHKRVNDLAGAALDPRWTLRDVVDPVPLLGLAAGESPGLMPKGRVMGIPVAAESRYPRLLIVPLTPPSGAILYRSPPALVDNERVQE